MLKKNDKVIMHNCLEAEEGKVYICQSDEFISCSGSAVVFLEKFSGYFLCEFLKVVK